MTLFGRAYDLAVLPSGSYAIATSAGIVEVDGDTFEVHERCAEPRGAQRILSIDVRHVVYERADGTRAECDRASGVVRPSASRATPRATARAGVRVSLRDGDVYLTPPGQATRHLRARAASLSFALRSDGRELLVGRRDGSVTRYTVPGGLPRASYRAHTLNAYAVGYDERHSRWVSVSGSGELAFGTLGVR